MKTEITFLGKVINVTSSDVEVEISPDIPTATPIINGRIYKLGQIGTFVKFPLGNLTLYGIVSSVSNSPTGNKEGLTAADRGSRFLCVQLVGEKVGNRAFDKGVGTFPQSTMKHMSLPRKTCDQSTVIARRATSR